MATFLLSVAALLYPIVRQRQMPANRTAGRRSATAIPEFCGIMIPLFLKPLFSLNYRSDLRHISVLTEVGRLVTHAVTESGPVAALFVWRFPGTRRVDAIHRVDPMKTFSQKNETVEKKWILIDAEGLVLGRLASIVAHAPARQAQADLHAAHGHGRQRHRHQCRQGPADRQQAQRQDLLLAHRLSRRHQAAQGARRSSRAASPSASSRRPSSACCRAARSAASR